MCSCMNCVFDCSGGITPKIATNKLIHISVYFKAKILHQHLRKQVLRQKVNVPFFPAVIAV